MRTGEPPSPEHERAMEVQLILHADHELNASTFAARVIASTMSDVYSSVTGAIGALKGPLHGGANEDVINMLDKIGGPNQAEAWIKEKLAQKYKVPGFGHRVYRTMDPRAVVLRKYADSLTRDNPDLKRTYDTALKVEQTVLANTKVYPNVDFFSGIVYRALGIPNDLFTPIFALSRAVGWTAHILEQWRNNRIIRPRAEYVGPMDLTYVALDQRS
jgi:citrate synthase